MLSTTPNSPLPDSQCKLTSHLDSQRSLAGARERVRTVFLFTDGQATTGVTNNARLKSILSMMLQASIRPTIHCFGFGLHYDAACLEAVAEAGQGQSYYIEDSESTPAAFASALGGLMSMVAQNVEVMFTPKVSKLAFTPHCKAGTHAGWYHKWQVSLRSRSLVACQTAGRSTLRKRQAESQCLDPFPVDCMYWHYDCHVNPLRQNNGTSPGCIPICMSCRWQHTKAISLFALCRLN